MHALVNLTYLVAAVLFIVGLKGLTHPRTAVRGNLLGATGMLLAALATLVNVGRLDLAFIGLLIGGAIGAVMAIRVQMTQMPELVALFNGFGGAASVLVAGAAIYQARDMGMAEFTALLAKDDTLLGQFTVATAASTIIGSVTFFGSLVAYGKLAGWKFLDKVRLGGVQAVNVGLLIVALILGAMIVIDPTNTTAYEVLVGVTALLGLLLVQPIGGADMPVVIALLNSYSGLAASATGFVLRNNVLIISGALVGASGIILTKIMCKAMNRSLSHVLFGVLQPGEDAPTADEVYAGRVKSTSADEVAMLLETARRVVFVPGYGMAVAQAQHAVRDLARILEDRGAEVKYAIHPVAGRMPGHMNVLLAEADVPYDQLVEMDDINPTFPQVDVAIVIGANDVVNPVARTDPKSPIAGMPIIDVDKARTVIVIKRSLSPGFAGIPNPLFAADNTLMYFGDGKKAILDLISAMKEL